MAQALSFPPRVSLEGEILKLIYITGKQSEGEKRKNTFICVKEKMKQKQRESVSQQRKPTDPDTRVLVLQNQLGSTACCLRPKCSLTQKQPGPGGSVGGGKVEGAGGVRRESCARVG